MHRELSNLSTDFWPVQSPDVRLFRSLYLADGRGDFDEEEFNRFLRVIVGDKLTIKETERRVAAANIFSSYILGEFYKQNDHWSVFRGWILTAAAIACVLERIDPGNSPMHASFSLARDAAEDALSALAKECEAPESFKPTRLEWDEYTRVRNGVALGAWAVWCLLNLDDKASASACVATGKSFLLEGRIGYWGESAFPSVCSLAWLFEQSGEVGQSEKLFTDWLMTIVNKQQPESEDALADPYVSPEDVLREMAEAISSSDGPSRRKAVQSYSLLPVVLLLMRRERRSLLSEIWKRLSHIRITVFEYDSPAEYLEWRCQKGIERDFVFMQPQSYGELDRLASKPPTNKLPSILREDLHFRLMFLLGLPHRLAWSIVGSLDHEFLKE